MKVCHVISGYFRDDARIFRRQAKSLERFGYEVHFITNDGQPDEMLQNIPFTSCRTQYPRWKTLIAAKHQFIEAIERTESDAYQLHAPELLPLAPLLKGMGKFIVYDAHEDLPRHILEKRWVPSFLRRPLAFLSEKYIDHILDKYVDEVITPLEYVANGLQKKIGKGVTVTNFPIVQPLEHVTQAQYLLRPNRFCYSGTVYSYSNQEVTLRAIENLPDVSYEIAGYVNEKHRQQLMRQPAAKRVIFNGRISRGDLRQIYTSSLAGLVVMDYTLNLGGRRGSYGVNKLFEYMEAGLPVICTDFELWKAIIDKYNCGIYVRPGHVRDIHEAITLLLNNKKLAYEMGQNGRRAIINEFNWEIEEGKYIDVFRRLDASQSRSLEKPQEAGCISPR